jgi:glycosyltransferase involved in cell wall biosynthesis
MKSKAIFITNRIYIDKSSNEGGVKLCTQDYMELLSMKFDLIVFPIVNRRSIWYRILVRLGINQYNDFKSSEKVTELHDLIVKSDVKYLFLNQSNTALFGLEVKKRLGDKISVFVCSHGNESGDLLHQVTRFRSELPFYRKVLSNWILGKTIRSEVIQRTNGIDGVLTVSEVEAQIENWLGAKKVFLVTRTIEYNPISYNKKIGIVGFIGDLSHAPNYYGIRTLCEAIKNQNSSHDLIIRIVGSTTAESKKIQQDFTFVNCIGYLTNQELVKECESWSFFLNPVFYYSRGVSTKLAKALSMGLPVITTEIGNRGYQWKEGDLPTVSSPEEMADRILELAFDNDKIEHYRKQVFQIVKSIPSFNELSLKLEEFVNR